MYNDPFIRKIILFYNSHKLLSYLLLINLLFFILFKEKFYVLFFFLFLLYFSGTLFIRRLSNFHLVITYFIGAVVGGTLFYLWQKTPFEVTDLKLFSAIIQSAVICVLAAITAYVPNYSFKIFIVNIKLKFITTILIIVNLLSVNVPSLYLAHLGGVAAGLLYGIILKNTHQKNWNSLLSFFRIISFRKPRMKAEYNSSRPLNDDDYNTIRVEKQKKMDSILDKISKSGYDSLSKEEKDFLFNSSKH